MEYKITFNALLGLAYIKCVVRMGEGKEALEDEKRKRVWVSNQRIKFKSRLRELGVADFYKFLDIKSKEKFFQESDQNEVLFFLECRFSKIRENDKQEVKITKRRENRKVWCRLVLWFHELGIRRHGECSPVTKEVEKMARSLWSQMNIYSIFPIECLIYIKYLELLERLQRVMIPWIYNYPYGVRGARQVDALLDRLEELEYIIEGYEENNRQNSIEDKWRESYKGKKNVDINREWMRFCATNQNYLYSALKAVEDGKLVDELLGLNQELREMNKKEYDLVKYLKKELSYDIFWDEITEFHKYMIILDYMDFYIKGHPNSTYARKVNRINGKFEKVVKDEFCCKRGYDKEKVKNVRFKLSEIYGLYDGEGRIIKDLFLELY